MVGVLNAEARQRLRRELPEWRPLAGRDGLTRTFVFTDFSEAWGFMSRVALLAEQQNHHPEWSNVWNRVEVTLSTHEAGGLTEKDAELARAIDAILASKKR